jgi:hypothetical protein
MSDRVLVIIDDPFELSSVGAALKLTWRRCGRRST